jgi:hypothetical protein
MCALLATLKQVGISSLTAQTPETLKPNSYPANRTEGKAGGGSVVAYNCQGSQGSQYSQRTVSTTPETRTPGTRTPSNRNAQSS